MEWNVFLAWLYLVTGQHCNKYEKANFKECQEHIVDCVLDGEKFRWCVKERIEFVELQRGCFP